MRTYRTDVLIVGSGFGACPPALRLKEKGIKVVMLEKGYPIDPMQDFKQSQNPNYILKYLKTLHSPQVSINYVEAEGGGSGFYENIAHRPTDFTYHLTDLHGYKLWPDNIDATIMDPYFTKVEKKLFVHQIPVAKIPKSGQVFALLLKKRGLSCERGKYAVRNCLNCGRCVTGCIYGAKQSLLLNYLPQAKRQGLEMVTRIKAISIKPLGHSNLYQHFPSLHSQPYRYEVVCLQANEQKCIYATKILILAGGTLGTTLLLLRSRKQLRQLSNQIGKNLAINYNVKQIARLPEWCPDGDMFSGQSHPGIFCFDFLSSDHLILTSGKAHPLQLFGAARIGNPAHGIRGFWGKEHIRIIKDIRRRFIIPLTYGIVSPIAELELKNSDNLEIRITNMEIFTNFYEHARKTMRKIMEDVGCTMMSIQLMGPSGMPFGDTHVTGSHIMGSCRMSYSDQKGVVNQDGEVHNYPGMYITDGSVIPSALGFGPSLTILANAERIADKIIQNYNLSA